MADDVRSSRPPGGGAPLAAALAIVEAAGVEGRTVVLVEGVSDLGAIEALAERRGIDLDRRRVSVVPLGGSRSFGPFVRAFGPGGLDVRLLGLYDAAEERDVERALVRAGLVGADASTGEAAAALAAAGFFRCDADLEDELIRAVGPERVEAVLAAEGELGSFRIMQRQPAQRDRAWPAQLRRFIGSRSGRKARYGRLLVEALGGELAPPPLAALLAQLD